MEKNLGPGYGHLLPKDIVTEPWYEVAVDIIGLWKVNYGNHGLTFNALTIIDTSTDFLEVIQCNWKSLVYVANQFQQAWLTQYPQPVQVIFYQGPEFVGTAFQNLLCNLGIDAVPITRKNPRSTPLLKDYTSLLHPL